MNTRPSVSEIDKLLMKYLQNPSVRRFQSGGTAENPEAPYVWHDDKGLWYEQHIGTGIRVYL